MCNGEVLNTENVHYLHERLDKGSAAAGKD